MATATLVVELSNAMSNGEIDKRRIRIPPRIRNHVGDVEREPVTRALVVVDDRRMRSASKSLRRVEAHFVLERSKRGHIVLCDRQAGAQKVRGGIGAKDASIFDAHLLVLEDPTWLDEVNRMLEKDSVNVEYAFSTVADKYVRTLAAIDDEYLRERATDLRDVTQRILHNLRGTHKDLDLKNLDEPCIILS